VAVLGLVHGPIVAAKDVAAFALDVCRSTVGQAEEDPAILMLHRDLQRVIPCRPR
jgi:hypothetical protein